MKLLYFDDVDVLEIVLSSEMGPAAETYDDPKNNTLLQYDEEGRLVGLTIHQASKKTDFEDLKESPHFEVSRPPEQEAAQAA